MEGDYQVFLNKLSKPAKRALVNAEITSFSSLAEMSKSELLALHGLGLKSLPLISQELDKQGFVNNLDK